MRIPALVLALILPLIMVFSAALVIQAGIRMDSAEDLKTKDYFQTSAFSKINVRVFICLIQNFSGRDSVQDSRNFGVKIIGSGR